MFRSIKSQTTKENGMTFIEVLIALVIMVTGILGAVAMQATAKKGSFDAMQRSLASALAQNIIERMRSDDASILNAYVSNEYGTGITCAGGCSAFTQTNIDEFELALTGGDVLSGNDNAGGLVDATACVDVSNNAVTVAITWQGRTVTVDGNTESCGASGKQRRQVLVEAFVY
ncbi:MAG: type IV pilus modification protein PilV [Colwellia sp.]|nr:type IV pilus modification protein PilV [Colwellia sp.]